MSSAPTPTRRIVTGHSKDGKAVFQTVDTIQLVKVAAPTGESAEMGVPWQSAEFPTDNNNTKDMQGVSDGPLHNENGTLLRVVWFPPGSVSPMHRTETMDYGVIVSGKITLELDDGVTQDINAGDIVVQRGTIHAWHNKTDKWTHGVFSMVAADKVKANGKPIDAVGHTVQNA